MVRNCNQGNIRVIVMSFVQSLDFDYMATSAEHNMETDLKLVVPCSLPTLHLEQDYRISGCVIKAGCESLGAER